VRILLQEVVLVRPDAVKAKLVGDDDFGQRLMNHPVFGAVVPRTWKLQFIQQAEIHDTCLPVFAPF
jgi:hypothetical protein